MFDLIKIADIHDFIASFISLVFKWSRNGDHVTAYFNFVFDTM